MVCLTLTPSSSSSTLQFRPLVEGRSTCGYVGLKNAGATCYMNSVLQQLFVQPEIKKAILSAEEEEEEGEEEGNRSEEVERERE